MPKKQRPPNWDDTPTKDEVRQMNGVWAMEDARAHRADEKSPKADKRKKLPNPPVDAGKMREPEDLKKLPSPSREAREAREAEARRRKR